MKKNENINFLILMLLILFLIVGVFFIYKGINNYNEEEAINISDIVKDDKKVAIKVDKILEKVRDNSFNDYYFVMSENHVYIVKIDIKKYNESNNKIIIGVTKNIPKYLEDDIVNTWKKIKSDSSINKDNYYNYFGKIYIDATHKYINNNYSFTGIICLGIAICLCILFVIKECLSGSVRTKKRRSR